MADTCLAADLIGHHGFNVLEWRGDDDAPEPGDRTSYGFTAMMQTDDYRRTIGEVPVGPLYLQVRDTSWGDYAGSSYTRSNNRRLLEDFPEVFVEMTESYDYSVLLVPATLEIPEHLADALRSIADDYPVYDESDLSDLESDLEREDWESYGRADLRAEVLDALREITDDEDVVDAVDDDITDDYLDAHMDWDERSHYGAYWQVETAVGGFFRFGTLPRKIAEVRSIGVRV
ncbi:hypothetical protein RHODO2019_10820 [Rhodococcus antarcticus]|uniref:Uncharacterized protein n=1 Tax=Rhodococcus antarcticus TaxID=2987751 RepID=A0ABY6NWD5_9NOCA|nr:hypothetical protein [Rhodococcus antarcticus]UZJ23700.1 hypothetical protein RHODO2019_10820 [Rhodococcus antarcticus]